MSDWTIPAQKQGGRDALGPTREQRHWVATTTWNSIENGRTVDREWPCLISRDILTDQTRKLDEVLCSHPDDSGALCQPANDRQASTH